MLMISRACLRRASSALHWPDPKSSDRRGPGERRLVQAPPDRSRDSRCLEPACHGHRGRGCARRVPTGSRRRPTRMQRQAGGVTVAGPLPMAGLLLGSRPGVTMLPYRDGGPVIGADGSEKFCARDEGSGLRLAASVACTSRWLPSVSRPIVALPREMSSQPKTGKLSQAQKNCQYCTVRARVQ